MPGTTGRAPGTLLSSFQTFLLAAALLLACPQPAASRSSRRLPKTAPVQTLALARPFLSVASRIGAHRPSVTSFARWSAAFQYFSAHSVFPTMRSEAVRAASDSAHQAPGHSIPAASRVQPKTYTLETLPFDNLAVRSLPLDPQPENFIRAVPNSVYSRVEPEVRAAGQVSRLPASSEAHSEPCSAPSLSFPSTLPPAPEEPGARGALSRRPHRPPLPRPHGAEAGGGPRGLFGGQQAPARQRNLRTLLRWAPIWRLFRPAWGRSGYLSR